MEPEEAARRTLARLPHVQPTDEQIAGLRALLNPDGKAIGRAAREAREGTTKPPTR